MKAGTVCINNFVDDGRILFLLTLLFHFISRRVQFIKEPEPLFQMEFEDYVIKVLGKRGLC